MKNHFITAYFGNKRDEVETIYNEIIKNNSFDNIKTIVEPFCGSSAMSYYISTKHPKKYKYILNDNNTFLIELYKIFSNEDKIKEFINKINKICFDKNLKFMTKEKYDLLMKETTVESYFIANKFYSIRPAMYPLNKNIIPLEIEKIMKIPIISFLKNENIIFTNEDAIKCINDNNNKESLILCDPPYLMACNDFYNSSNTNIYEWFYDNNKLLINTAFVLESTWVIKLLFKDIGTKTIYEKIYRGPKKKKVDHIIAFFNN